MIELVKTLQKRISELEQANFDLRCDNARYENARVICAIEVDHLRRKLGFNNTHPAVEKCRCEECTRSVDRA